MSFGRSRRLRSLERQGSRVGLQIVDETFLALSNRLSRLRDNRSVTRRKTTPPITGRLCEISGNLDDNNLPAENIELGCHESVSHASSPREESVSAFNGLHRPSTTAR